MEGPRSARAPRGVGSGEGLRRGAVAPPQYNVVYVTPVAKQSSVCNSWAKKIFNP